MISRLVLLTCLFITVLTLDVSAQSKRRESLRQRLLKQFDKDGDGKLSAAEREEAKKAIQKRRRARADQRQPKRMTWKVSGLERTALVYLPNKNKAQAPVVFGFHGHGGNSRNSARTFRMQELWPEAIVVYMQGVPTAGRLTDPEGKKNGWQHAIDENGARDLKFFDTVLKDLKTKYRVDASRIYALGHSNGGGFTYLLWAARPGTFAAIAPSSAGSRSLRTTTPDPVPVMHIAGRADRLVKFSWQERTMERVRTINKTAEQGKAWTAAKVAPKGATVYASKQGAPLVTLIHPGSHRYHAAAPEAIVAFFKQYRRSVADSAATSSK